MDGSQRKIQARGFDSLPFIYANQHAASNLWWKMGTTYDKDVTLGLPKVPVRPWIKLYYPGLLSFILAFRT